MTDAGPLARPRPKPWAITLAFAIIYLSWGTTYLAIKEGVKEFPPALFGGVRITLAGLIILAWAALRGGLPLPRRDLIGAAIGGVFLFIGGNGLITLAEKTVDSGVASVLVATTPLWLALLETAWPWGERLSLRGWTGLLVGLGGVFILLAPRLSDPAAFLRDAGPLLVLGSSSSWALGSFILRYQKRRGSHLANAGCQMLIGGLGLLALAFLAGEHGQLTAERFTWPAVVSFFHLLIVGSLIGFTAYNWLLEHVSATLAGTYAYVNPAVAILVGWLVGGEEITGWIVGGMLVILAGVALVRSGAGRSPATAAAPAKPEAPPAPARPTARADRLPEPAACECAE
jgi:drug/metabolite transporter (DMT)-like permease